MIMQTFFCDIGKSIEIYDLQTKPSEFEFYTCVISNVAQFTFSCSVAGINI